MAPREFRLQFSCKSQLNVQSDDGPLISEEDRDNLPILVLNEFDFLFELDDNNNGIRHFPDDPDYAERMINVNRIIDEWITRNMEDGPGYDIEEFGKY